MAKTKTATKTASTAKKTASASGKVASGKTATGKKGAPKRAASHQPGDEDATIDRRRGGRRADGDAGAKVDAPKLERREKVNRRRQIDPTTCERDYTDAEVQFMNALDDYKRTSGRMFPTCSEVLEVIRGLGYVQLSQAELSARNAADPDLEARAEAAANEALAASEELSGGGF